MVNAKAAGVSFSVDPVTRKNNVKIDMIEGLAEDLVSGTRSSLSVEINKGEPHLEGNNLLTSNQIRENFEKTIFIEKELGYPVDIEWAIDDENTLFFLQCRPITTLDEPTIDELNTTHDIDGDIITNHNVGEMLPGAITPLTISTVVYAIDLGLRRMLTKIGLFKKLSDTPEEMLISHYYGHLFFNMRHLYRLSGCVFGASKDGVDIAICGRVLDFSEQKQGKAKSRIRRVLNTMKYMGYLFSNKKAIKHSYKLARKIDIKGEDPISLFNSIDENLKHLNDILSDHYVTSSFSGTMVSSIYQTLLKDNTEEVAKMKVAQLLEDIPNIESADILMSLREVKKAIILQNIDLNELTDDEIYSLINDGKNEVINAKYLHFINKHGHRTIKESELMIPGWKDDKESLILYLRTIPAKVEQESNSSIKSDNKVILDQYKGMKKSMLNMFVKNARKGCVRREFSKSQMIYAVDKFKVAYRKLAKMLKSDNLLSDEELIFFLTHEELRDLIKNRKTKYIKTSIIRKRLFVEQSSLKFEHVYKGKPMPIKPEYSTTSSGDTLMGTSLSKGYFRGVARIVTSIEEAKELKKDEIMVSSYTDIGWSPYYSIIGALVTEVGSALSHGAVVAREFGLPIISNVDNATLKIKSGDLIEVNANDGLITIIESMNK
jgi:pyruvate,water dikinase